MSRFIGNVLAVPGVLLLADAGLPLAWQEPVSALMAARSQSELAQELDEEFARLSGRPAARARGEICGTRRSGTAADCAGGAVARIELPTLDRSYVMVQGTDTATLRKGPAHYPERHCQARATPLGSPATGPPTSRRFGRLTA